MSSYGGSSTGTGNMALFDKPKVYADPEVVKETLTKCLSDYGSTLGIALDLEEIERLAMEEERNEGEKFMNKQMKLHELESFEKAANGSEGSSDDDSQDLEFFGEDGEIANDGDAAAPGARRRTMTTERMAEITFASDGAARPKGLLSTAGVPGPQAPGMQLSKEKMAAMKRRNSSRRRSSGLSSYDDLAYNMFGGDNHVFTQQYMTSKWKKEAKAMFEEAHGVKRHAKFTGVRNDGDDDDDDEGSTAVSVEPGEVPAHTRMRLNRIDGVKVVRHELNVDGLYGGLQSQMERNLSIMSSVTANSEKRLEERKLLMKHQHEALIKRKAQEEKDAIAKAEEEAIQREAERANGSSLPGIGDLLNMDKKAFKAEAMQKMQEKGGDDDASVASTNSSIG
jgi:hypothetical protein